MCACCYVYEIFQKVNITMCLFWYICMCVSVFFLSHTAIFRLEAVHLIHTFFWFERLIYEYDLTFVSRCPPKRFFFPLWLLTSLLHSSIWLNSSSVFGCRIHVDETRPISMMNGDASVFFIILTIQNELMNSSYKMC